VPIIILIESFLEPIFNPTYFSLQICSLLYVSEDVSAPLHFSFANKTFQYIAQYNLTLKNQWEAFSKKSDHPTLVGNSQPVIPNTQIVLFLISEENTIKTSSKPLRLCVK